MATEEIISKPGAAIEVTVLHLSPAERKALSVPKDAWDYAMGDESLWQVIKRVFRRTLRACGINWKKIPLIRGQWKNQ